MRSFPASFALLAAPVLLAGCGGGGGGHGTVPPPVTVTHSVAAGDVTQTSVELSAIAPQTGTVVFEVSTDPAFGSLVATSSAPVTDVMVPAKVAIAGLTPATTYHYRARIGTTTLTPGTFRTPAAAGTQAGLHFGVLGDWRQDMLPYPAVRNAPDMALDFAVELGDTIYADVASPAVPAAQAQTIAEFRARHQEAYSTVGGLNTLGDLRDSTAVFATTDDHEVIDDYAGGADASTDPRFSTASGFINDTPLFETAMQAFEEWNPIAHETYTTGGAAVLGETKFYRFRTFGSDAAVFVLDERSFRSQELNNPDVTDPPSVDAFKQASFDPTRTMLGDAQLQDLEVDLLAAQTAGVTWKFVMIPEPIQNLGPANARDRYEGYAFERSQLLGYIHDNAIQNVVFIAADIHGTVVNNLQYQPTSPSDAQVDVDAFEVSVPAVAYDPPLGEDAVSSTGLVIDHAIYDSLSHDQQDAVFESALNQMLDDNGYTNTGLEDSNLTFSLLQGRWVRANEFGWGEFQVDPVTEVLTVTIWGIDPYTPSGAAGAASSVPQVLTRFTVTPQAIVP